MWIGACTSQAGTQMQTAAQAWLVLELANDPFWLGVDQFMAQIPIVLFALLAGVVADRHDRRRILLSSQYTQMTSALLMAALAFTGVIQVWHILILSFVVGTAQAFGGPSYSALIPTLVPREHLPNAIALNSIQFNFARVIGPTLAGLALAISPAWCFTLNGVSFLAVIATLYVIQVSFVPQKTSEPMLDSMRQGVRFILGQPGMRPLIVLAFMVTLLGFQVLAFVPVFARDVFKGGTTTFTLMLSCSGAGAVSGALVVAALGKKKHLGRTGLLALLALGALTAGYAQAPNVGVACVMIFLCGVALMSVFSMLTSLVQLITPDEMRGRVMSVYNLALRGGGPIGAPIAGTLIPIFGAPAVTAVCGVLMVCLALYFLLVNRRVAML
jgi:predicted MFS family arabinose efflux permease